MAHAGRLSRKWAAAAVSWACGLFLLLPAYERCHRESYAVGRRLRDVVRCLPTRHPWYPLAGLGLELQVLVLLAVFGLPLALALARPTGLTALVRFCAGIVMGLFGVLVLEAPPLAGVPRSQGLWLAAGALWVWSAVGGGEA